MSYHECIKNQQPGTLHLASDWPPAASSSQLLAKLMESEHNVIFEFDLQSGEFIHLAPPSAALLGQQLTRWTTDPAVLIDLVFAGKPPLVDTVRRVRRLTEKGGVVWSEHTSSPIFEDGAVVRLFGAIRNVTQQVYAEETQATTSTLFSAIFTGAPDAIFVKDASGRYVMMNTAAEKLLGLKSAEVIGKTVNDLYIPNQAQPTNDSDHQVLTKGINTAVELNLTTHKGDEQITWVTKSPIVANDGRITGLVSIARDITEQKRAERALHQSEEFVRAILDSIPAEIALIKSDGTIEDTNKAWKIAMDAIYDMRCGPGDAYFDFLLNICDTNLTPISKLHDLAAAVKSGDTPVGNIEIRAHCGELERWLSLSLIRLSGDSNGRIVAVHEDVTNRMTADAALRTANEMAQTANRAKSEFLSRMSHELRTPLNAILGFAQLLEQAEIAESDKEDASQIVKAGRHLLNLINEILDISRIEAGRLALSLEPVLVRETIHETVSLMRSLASDRSVAIELKETPDWDSHVFADKQRLKQVLLNLLANAVKFNRLGGSIAIDVVASSKLISISVTDTGYGIEEDKLSSVFDPFDRLGADEFGTEGTGLGLTVTKRLVEAMHGEIDVRSKVGVGTTFTVRLPPKEPNSAPYEYDDPLDPDGAKRDYLEGTVLYIEDNPGNTELIKRILEPNTKCQLVATSMGRDGVDLAVRLLPDVILLDINLPDMNGRDVLVEIRTNPTTRQTPVLVVTANVVASVKRELLSLGATVVLGKPIDITELTTLVSDLLTKRKVGLDFEE
ncbi:MAG TPA: PAS domain S-box protein [Capsulimonadaceae bacterium]|jgi:PAS domain S-box-containing protein